MTRPDANSWQLDVLGMPTDESPRSYILSRGSSRLQIDAGIEPSKRVDQVVLTHAHSNRVGALSTLGRAGQVIETETTRAIRRAFPGSFSGETTVREFGWHEDLAVSGIQIGLLASGHIPGAAAVALADDQQMVVWGGDIGWDPRPGLPGIKGAPEWEGLAPAVVYLEGPLLDDEDVVSESAGFERLLHEAQLAIEHGGRLLVAAAGCGRAQSLLASVGKAMDEGKLPVQPVGVDRLTAAVADSWPSTIQCPRSVDHASATILIMSTRLMFPGTPSAAAATELADDPRSRIVIAGGVIEQTPAGNLLYGGAESRCAVSQIPFADRLTWRGLREFTDWVRPGRIEFVTAENAKHRYR